MCAYPYCQPILLHKHPLFQRHAAKLKCTNSTNQNIFCSFAQSCWFLNSFPDLKRMLKVFITIYLTLPSITKEYEIWWLKVKKALIAINYHRCCWWKIICIKFSTIKINWQDISVIKKPCNCKVQLVSTAKYWLYWKSKRS